MLPDEHCPPSIIMPLIRKVKERVSPVASSMQVFTPCNISCGRMQRMKLSPTAISPFRPHLKMRWVHVHPSPGISAYYGAMRTWCCYHGAPPALFPQPHISTRHCLVRCGCRVLSEYVFSIHVKEIKASYLCLRPTAEWPDTGHGRLH